MAIITDEMLLEAYNTHSQSAKTLAEMFGMAESSIHYRLAKLRDKKLITQTAQPNQHTKQNAQPTQQPVIRDLMTNTTTPVTVFDPFEQAWEDAETDTQIEEQVPTPTTTQENATLPEQNDIPPIVTERTVMHVQPKTDWEAKIKELVPPKKPYIERNHDVQIDTLFDHGMNVILQGEAGTGKTRAIQYYAEKKGLPFLRISCDDNSQLRNCLGTMQAANGTTWFKEGILLELIKKPAVILFDEFNCLPASRLFFLHEILDNRKVHVQELDQAFNIVPECKIALACNPNTARYSGTNKINTALTDRCAAIIMPCMDDDFLNQFIKAEDRKKFFKEVNKTMEREETRASFSLRGAMRTEQLINNGMSIKDAYRLCFFNTAAITASPEIAMQLEQTARVIVKGYE